MRNFAGIILAGGKSTRMGRDKSFILFSGKPLIETVMEKMAVLFREIVIITNTPYLYHGYGVKIYSDIFKDAGPLGGIYTGLVCSKKRYNFFTGCDMPFINYELVKYMAGVVDGNDIVIPEYNGRYEPLCAIYSRDCIKVIEENLSERRFKISEFFQYVKIKIIREEVIKRFDPEGISFMNINTPADRKKLEEIQKKI